MTIPCRQVLAYLLIAASVDAGAAPAVAPGLPAASLAPAGAPALPVPPVAAAVKPEAGDVGVSAANPYNGVLARFDGLLRTYQPLGRPLRLRTPDSGRSGGASELPEGSPRAEQVIRLLRERVARLAASVQDLGMTAGAAGSGGSPDVLLTVQLREAASGVLAPVPVPGPVAGDVALDLDLIDFARAVPVPQVRTSETLSLGSPAGDGAFDFRLAGSGHRLRGEHAREPEVQRVMVDLGLVELLGRYLLVPYWRCIPGAQSDGLVEQRIAARFAARRSTERILWLRATLRQYGFTLAEGDALDAATRSAVDHLIARFNFRRPSDYLDAGLFADIYLHIPLQESAATARAPATAAATPAAAGPNPAAGGSL